MDSDEIEFLMQLTAEVYATATKTERDQQLLALWRPCLSYPVELVSNSISVREEARDKGN